jgi:tetratricopeptide (TPR) repeat protein
MLSTRENGQQSSLPEPLATSDDIKEQPADDIYEYSIPEYLLKPDEEKSDPADDNFLAFRVFDPRQLRRYLKLLDQAQEHAAIAEEKLKAKQAKEAAKENVPAHAVKEDYLHAAEILTYLIEYYPDYPDAFIAFGDLSAKQKLPRYATSFYRSATLINPNDYHTEMKYELQLAAFNKTLPANTVGSTNTSELLKKIRSKKAEEILFRPWYHTRLQLGLKKQEIEAGNLSDNTDYQDVTLTNGAAVDAFLGAEAQKREHVALANFYYLKALLKYPHDFISLTQYIYNNAYTGADVESVLQRLGEVINTYQHLYAYFARYCLYHRMGRAEEARADLHYFLSRSDCVELLKIGKQRKTIVNILENATVYPHPEHDDDTSLRNDLTPEEKLQAAVIMPKLDQTIQNIRNGVYRGDLSAVLAKITAVIHHFPHVANLYVARACILESLNNYDEAILNYALAIWHGKEETHSSAFFLRARAHITLGRVQEAHADFKSLVAMQIVYYPQNWKLLVDKSKKQFSDSCLDIGIEHVQKNRLETAISIFKFGIEILPMIDLYLECAAAMEKLGQSYTEINNFLEKDLDLIIVEMSIVNNKFMSRTDYYKQKQLDEWALKNGVVSSQSELCKNPAEESKEILKPARKKNPPPQKLALPKFKKDKSSTQLISVNLAIEKSKLPDKQSLLFFQQEEAEREKQEKLAADEHKRLKKRTKDKEKKQRRKTRLSIFTNVTTPEEEDSSSDEDKSPPLMIVSTLTDPKETIRVDLTEFEQMIFATLNALIPAGDTRKYKTYLYGGSAYDKICKQLLGTPCCVISDTDMVTEIPPEYLSRRLTSIPEVPGLFKLIIDKLRIDVTHVADLSCLARAVLKLDFLTFYIDAEGNVTDATGYGLHYMREKQLRGALPPAEIFKTDPLVILRALYTSTKRDLKIPSSLKKQILTDRHLLVPAENNSEGQPHRYLHPRRMNIRLGRLHSQYMAAANFKLLNQYRLLEALFPSINAEMQNDLPWIETQVAKSGALLWPKISIIYSIFIASAIAQRELLHLLNHSGNNIHPAVINSASAIRNSSPLFCTAFPSLEEDLLIPLQRQLHDWLQNHPQLEPAPGMRNSR